MEKNYNIDEIENFLNREMDASELAAFEQQMAKDEGLAEEVTFHQDILKGIDQAGAADFRSIVAGVHEEMKNEQFFSEKVADKVIEKNAQKEATVRRISFGRSLAIAASFALLLVAGWWILSQPTDPNDLFQNNFAMHENVLSIEIEDRLAETGFGANKVALADLQTGIEQYENGDYTAAIATFQNFKNVAPNDPLSNYATFYESIAFLKTNKITEAQGSLVDLAANTAFPLQEDAQWYLALTYLKLENIDAAKTQLEQLQPSDKYGTKAKQLLRKL
ncbi:MAG: hypothetical protein AAF960_00010 [Bacteroidota bacterium]